jgi:RimJ/RimL family protein N-acetyltransferase
MLYLLDAHETDRLEFRLLKSSDFESWLDLFKTPGVARFLAFDPQLSPVELCQVWFDKNFHRYENNLGGMNVLVDKTTKKMIGQCGLLIQELDEQQEMEIGYAILPQYSGQGYATEAARYCKQVAFRENYSESLISIVHVENLASKKVAKKNDMTLDKRSNFRDIPVDVFRIWKDAVKT